MQLSVVCPIITAATYLCWYHLKILAYILQKVWMLCHASDDQIFQALSPYLYTTQESEQVWPSLQPRDFWVCMC